MPRVTASGAQVVRALGTIGFVKVSQKGSHAKLKDDTGRTVIVPLHRELKQGTLRSVCRQAGITVERLIDLL